MVTIEYKKFQLKVTSARGERSMCEHCKNSYTCLDAKTQEFTEYATRYMYSDERMRQDAFNRLDTNLKDSALELNSSRGRCRSLQ
jgi:hypothetical protein